MCREALQSKTKWISENVINAGQLLLQSKYGTSGLQHTGLGDTLNFEAMEEEFVQVLHSGGNHWLLITTMGCPPGIVKIYDSMVNKLPFQTKEQICALLVTKEPQIEVLHIDVQQQKNSNDCGLFALAFATALCSGQEPRELHFDAGAMREHLLQCINADNMEPFPCVSMLKKKRKCRKDIIEVFCICRTQEGGRMAACVSCGEWFHEDCVPLPKAVWKEPNFKWSCASC